MKWTFVLLALTQWAYAQIFFKTPEKECNPIDLRNEKLEQIRNQKEVAWCYAFTAADHLAYTFNLSETVSAADIAINYNDSDLGLFARWLHQTFGRITRSESENFMMAHQTGFNKVALDRGMRDGYCPERIFPSESWIKMTRVGEDWVETKVNLREAMLAIFNLLKNQDTLTAFNLPFYFHFKNVESPEEFLALIKGSTSSDFYSRLRKEVCKYDRMPFPERYKVSMNLKNTRIFQIMNDQLDSERLVGIDYDSRVLEDHTNRSVSLAELHTSSIVARRWNRTQNECQYLIRDSHGKQCTRYDSTYECLGGQVWMNESLLYLNLISMVYIHSP